MAIKKEVRKKMCYIVHFVSQALGITKLRQSKRPITYIYIYIYVCIHIPLFKWKTE